jgi:hypothetical protein
LIYPVAREDPFVPAQTPPPFASDAWLLVGLTRSIAGRLAWNGRLRFTAGDGDVFDVTPGQLTSVNFPWYYFGGGVKLRTHEGKYRLSFVKPNGAEYAVMRGAAAAGNPAALVGAAAKVSDVRSGRRVGRRWRDILSALHPPAR